MDKKRALDVLKRIAEEQAPGLPFSIIKEVYEAEAEYLFEGDEKPMNILKQIAEAYIDENNSTPLE